MVYLKLFHGRPDPKQDMDDWGERGPIIGPCVYVHIVYGNVIHLGHPESDERNVDLNIDDGLVHLNGMYYGDLSVTSREVLAGDGLLGSIMSMDELNAAMLSGT
jgi:hypothetical protein